MLVVCPYLWRNVGIGEDGQLAVRLWYDRCALYVLVVAEPDIDRRVADGLQQPRARMLVQHALAECTELFPLVAAILRSTARQI